MIASKTILFITGAFVHHSCWNNWVEYFNGQGYRTVNLPWPHKESDPRTLRNRQPDAGLASLSLPELLAYYQKIAADLPEKPIVIGHSYGGLIAQVLLNKGFASACVAIHAVPPQGVIPYEVNFYRSNTKALGFFTSLRKTYLMSYRSWQFVFANGLDPGMQKSSYYELAIPESKRVLQGGLTKAAKIDFKKPHPPLLILGGTQDHCIPSHLCRRVYQHYTHASSVTTFVEKHRNHMVLGLPTWREDAEFVLEWILQQ